MRSPHLYAILINAKAKKAATFLSSSVVEQSAVNRSVAGSNPAWGVTIKKESTHCVLSFFMNCDKIRQKRYCFIVDLLVWLATMAHS